jgi:hypothetical protein
MARLHPTFVLKNFQQPDVHARVVVWGTYHNRWAGYFDSYWCRGVSVTIAYTYKAALNVVWRG